MNHDESAMPSVPTHLAKPLPVAGMAACFVGIVVGMTAHFITNSTWREPSWGTTLAAICTLTAAFVIPYVARPRPGAPASTDQENP